VPTCSSHCKIRWTETEVLNLDAGMPSSTTQSQQISTTMQETKQLKFDKGLLGRWLHMLLVAFYNDEEAVVADLLYQRAALVRDTAIAQVLGLPDRQVRQALERRLVPDFIVERQIEGMGKQTRSYYRISPSAVLATARKLQMLEDTLAQMTNEEYHCPKCSRTYDSMQAMSLTRRQDKSDSGGSLAFMCEECDEELTVIHANSQVQYDRLHRFRSQCRDLLLLTRQLKDMPIPHFAQQEERDKMRIKAGTLPNMQTVGMDSNAPSKCSSASSITTGLEHRSSRQTPWDEWFHQEILGSNPRAGSTRDASALPSSGLSSEEGSNMLQEAVRHARQRLSDEVQQHMEDARRKAAGANSCDAPTSAADISVLVQGKAYSLEQVRADEDLQDSMTDEEYQKFAELDRQHDKLKISRAGQP